MGKTERQVLIAALDAIKERGWCQRASSTPRGEVCLSGAINVATFGRPRAELDAKYRTPHQYDLNLRVRSLVLAEINRDSDYEWWMTEWNDHPGRKRREIRAILKAAIARQDKKF